MEAWLALRYDQTTMNYIILYVPELDFSIGIDPPPGGNGGIRFKYNENVSKIIENDQKKWGEHRLKKIDMSNEDVQKLYDMGKKVKSLDEIIKKITDTARLLEPEPKFSERSDVHLSP